jgi:hypothetical protein
MFKNSNGGGANGANGAIFLSLFKNSIREKKKKNIFFFPV